jgi:tight adherence protein C
VIGLTEIALVCGGLAGLGVFLIIRGLVPAGPALGPALERLHPRPEVAHPRSKEGLVESLTRVLRLAPPMTELRLIGQTVDRYVLEKVGYALFGLLFPAFLTEILSLLGIGLHWYVPTVVGIGCAIGMFLLVDVSIKQKAAKAREEFRRVVATYLTLVGLVRYAGSGAVESLEQAARIGDGWVFDRIRHALDTARYANEAPWNRLRQVSVEIGVPDLGEVGDIMSLVGDQGAQVYQTLISRAQSMRTALRTAEQKRAATATTLLYIPTTMLLFVFIILIGYPALVRVAG